MPIITKTKIDYITSFSYGNIYLYDGVIKADSVIEEYMIPNITISSLETNRPESDFIISVINGTFDSTALDSLPQPFYASLFNINDFIFKNYSITNSGSGSASWIENQISTGMLFNARYGIGYFYFLLINTDNIIEPVKGNVYVEEISPEVKYWDYLSTFFDYLQ